jgi:hypothetical protein
MDAYAFALTLGTAGLAAMTVLGFHHGHAPGGSGHGHHSIHLRGGGRAGGHAGHQHHAPTTSRLLPFLSPRLWFSLLVGFGATGLLVGGHATAGVACTPGTGSRRLNDSTAYWNSVISREPGGAA